MSSTKATRTVVVGVVQGMHMRPAERLVAVAKGFQSQIALIKGNERVDARSIMDILMLAAVQGTELTIEADGPDADGALQALGKVFDNNFTEDEPVHRNQQQAG